MSVLTVGVDPGMKTGVAVARWTEDGGRGLWEALRLEEPGLIELGVLGEAAGLTGALSGSSGGWWNQMVLAGAGLAERVRGLVDEFAREGDEGDEVVVVMEDFILRPGAGVKGIGGRDVLIPVAMGSVFWGAVQASVGSVGSVGSGHFYISPPAAKSVISTTWLEDHFGGRSAIMLSDGVRGAKGHARDALRHAVLGVRMHEACG